MILNLGCGHKTSDKMLNIDFVSDNKDVIEHNLLKPLPYADNSIDLIYHSNVLEHFAPIDAINFIKDNFRLLKPGGIIRCVVPDLENAAREYIKIVDECRQNEINAKHQWMIIELIDQLNRNKAGGEMSSFLSSNHGIEDYIVSRIGSIKGIDSYKSKKLDFSFKKIKRLFFRVLSKILGPTYNLGSFRKGGECHLWMYDELSLHKLFLDCGFKNIKKMNEFESNSQFWLENNLDIDFKNQPIDPSGLIIEAIKETE